MRAKNNSRVGQRYSYAMRINVIAMYEIDKQIDGYDMLFADRF